MHQIEESIKIEKLIHGACGNTVVIGAGLLVDAQSHFGLLRFHHCAIKRSQKLASPHVDQKGFEATV